MAEPTGQALYYSWSWAFLLFSSEFQIKHLSRAVGLVPCHTLSIHLPWQNAATSSSAADSSASGSRFKLDVLKNKARTSLTSSLENIFARVGVRTHSFIIESTLAALPIPLPCLLPPFKPVPSCYCVLWWAQSFLHYPVPFMGLSPLPFAVSVSLSIRGFGLTHICQWDCRVIPFQWHSGCNRFLLHTFLYFKFCNEYIFKSMLI